jgi:hypothetical protein
VYLFRHWAFKCMYCIKYCLLKHRAIKAGKGMEVNFYTFLTSAFPGGLWSASRSGFFTCRVRASGTHWKWTGWAPEPFWKTLIKRKIPSLPKIKHWTSGCQSRYWVMTATEVVSSLFLWNTLVFPIYIYVFNVRDLRQKLIVSWLLKEFPAFYGTKYLVACS